MSRIVNRFKYRNKTFRAGELTVGDYMLSWRDPEYFAEKVLTEFNESPPDLTKEESEAFLSILMGAKGSIDELFRKSGKKPSGSANDDFHIMLGWFQRVTGNGYRDTMEMPLAIFTKMVDDLGIIAGQKEYDKNRNSTKPDKKAFRDMFGT